MTRKVTVRDVHHGITKKDIEETKFECSVAFPDRWDIKDCKRCVLANTCRIKREREKINT